MRLRWTSLCNIRRNECPRMIYTAYQRSTPNSTRCKSKFRKNVIRRLNELSSLADQSMTSASKRRVDGSRHCHDVPSPIRRCSGKAEKVRGCGRIQRQKRLCASHSAIGLAFTPFGSESATGRHWRHDESILVQQLMQKPSPLTRPYPVRTARLPDKSPGARAKRTCQKRRFRSGKMSCRQQQVATGSESLAENLRIVQSFLVRMRAAADRKYRFFEKACVTAMP